MDWERPPPFSFRPNFSLGTKFFHSDPLSHLPLMFLCLLSNFVFVNDDHGRRWVAVMRRD